MVAGGFQPVNQNTVFICVASQSPQSETEQHHRLPPDHTRVRKAWGKVAGGISSPNQCGAISTTSQSSSGRTVAEKVTAVRSPKPEMTRLMTALDL